MTTIGKRYKKTILAGVAVFVLLAGATALQAKEKGLGDMNQEQLNEAIHEYIVNNPAVVIDALKRYQDIQKEEEAAGFKDALVRNMDAIMEGGHDMAGNPDGDVTIIEFFDYNCGYCKKAVDDVKRVIEADNNVRVIFMEYPILSQSSADTARWAMAAGKQDKYWEYHLALMESPGVKSESMLEKMAKDVGLDVKKLRKDADSKEIRARLEESVRIARELGITGTPAFIIGDTLAPGYMGFDNMKKAVEDARRDSKG